MTIEDVGIGNVTEAQTQGEGCQRAAGLPERKVETGIS
jgi:hypothetical protein